MDKRLNPELLGCPLYRKLMPRKRDIVICDILYPLLTSAIDFGAIWAIESRELHDSVDIAKNIGSYFILFLFTLMLILLWSHDSRHRKQEYEKRAQRLQRIPERDFWELDSELSMAELQYGTFYFLKHYLYSPRERLLVRYADISTWHFGDFGSAFSGTLQNQFLDIVEADGFKTQILIKQRAKISQERGQVTDRLNCYIKYAKYPNGSPYRSSNGSNVTKEVHSP